MDRPTVAILGASSDRSKFGNKAVRAHVRQGYEVYPVNAKGGRIEGLRVYKSLTAIPIDHFNRISVYLAPAIGIEVLDAVAAKRCDEFFLNPGSENEEVIAKARSLGLEPIVACSIVDLGVRPEQFADT